LMRRCDSCTPSNTEREHLGAPPRRQHRPRQPNPRLPVPQQRGAAAGLVRDHDRRRPALGAPSPPRPRTQTPTQPRAPRMKRRRPTADIRVNASDPRPAAYLKTERVTQCHSRLFRHCALARLRTQSLSPGPSDSVHRADHRAQRCAHDGLADADSPQHPVADLDLEVRGGFGIAS